MFITKETDYAIRLLRGLADGNRRTVAELSTNEQVPRQFAYKILKKLQSSGMIHIIRGVEGGCVLAKELNQLTLLDLMKATGDDTMVISCMEPGYECQWRAERNNEGCRVHQYLCNVQRGMERELATHTLQEIMFGTVQR